MEIIFTDKLTRDLIDVIESADNCVLSTLVNFRELWLESEQGTELRLLALQDFSLTISRVNFINRRQGTMTKVFQILKQFCEERQIGRLVVQSVLTPEMAAWCEKNGFEPDKYASFPANGFISGDWVMKFS